MAEIFVPRPPYADYGRGYLYIEEGRRVCKLIDSEGNRHSVSLARYLVAVHLGRRLGRDEHVDHINNNPLDDRLDNYQILSPSENARKSARYGRTLLVVICPVCSTVFARLGRFETARGVMCCSRSCGSKFSTTPYTDAYIEWVKSVQVPMEIYEVGSFAYVSGISQLYCGGVIPSMPPQIHNGMSSDAMWALVEPHLGKGRSFLEIGKLTSIPWYTVRDLAYRRR